MTSVLAAASVAVLVTMTLALVRALLGPTLYDRVMAVNMVGTKTVLLIAIIDSLSGNHQYLDISLVYALINFIGVIALPRFFHFAKPDDPESGLEQEGQR